jgi:hypothetical protein
VTVLLDGHCFILALEEVIAADALHVYYSVLPFVSKKTLLYDTCTHYAMDSVNALQGVEFH